MLMLALCVLPLGACGDDDDAASDEGSAGSGDHSADHSGDSGQDHTTCGLQENCPDDPVDPTAGVITIPGEDGNFSVMIHEATELTTMNTWKIMVMGEGSPVAGASVTAYMWSVDCMHKGPTPDQEVTTGDNGMVDVELVSVHGGPWNAVFEIEADGMTDTVTVELCIPGASHGGDTTDDAGA
jgi:hypothetical protein